MKFCEEVEAKSKISLRIYIHSSDSIIGYSLYNLGRPIDMVQLHWPPSLGWQEKEYLNAFTR